MIERNRQPFRVLNAPMRQFGKDFIDRRRIVEVLQNLLDNAAKFMGDQAEPRIEVGVETNRDEPVFFVRDNGIGIEPEYQEKVFGLFERLDQKIEGTGVGLTLAKRIIEVHNGRLWVESAGKGQGATFYFTLPMLETIPQDMKASSEMRQV